MSTLNYRGYIGCNMAFGRSVPQNVQQLVIRDYCQRHGLTFLLSATEYHEGSMMLDSLLDDHTEGLVFYSIYLLPKCQKSRERLYNANKDIRFAAENIHKVNVDLFETMFKVGEYHESSQFRHTVTYLKPERLSREDECRKAALYAFSKIVFPGLLGRRS